MPEIRQSRVDRTNQPILWPPIYAVCGSCGETCDLVIEDSCDHLAVYQCRRCRTQQFLPAMGLTWGTA